MEGQWACCGYIRSFLVVGGLVSSVAVAAAAAASASPLFFGIAGSVEAGRLATMEVGI